MSLQQQQQQVHANAAYGLSLADEDWAGLIQHNREAQDLLSTAIAHHEHYREQDQPSGGQRNKGISHLHHKNDPSQSKVPASEGYDETQQYSEGDNSSDEGHAPGDGKPAPKKAGRKPLTTEPTNKRKAQNRAAQRAFRDRKERYVKSLEERIKELEDLNPNKSDTKLAEENQNLKVLVQKLETENYFLKEQSFTFDFPISQPGLYGLQKSARDNALQNQAASSSSEHSSPSSVIQPLDSASATSSASSLPICKSSTLVPSTSTTTTATVPAKTAVSSSSAHRTKEHLPWSPSPSLGDSVPNSPLEHSLPTTDQETISQVSFADNAGVVPRFRGTTPEEFALFSSLMDNTTGVPTHSHNPYSAIHTNNLNTNDLFNNMSGFQQYSTSHFSPATTTSSLDTRHHSSQSPTSTLTAYSNHSPSPTVDELVNTPLFETDKHGNVLFSPPTGTMSMPPLNPTSLTFEQTQALFTDYRDPSDNRDFFQNFEDPLGSSFGGEHAGGAIGGLFQDQLLDYANSFANVASTPAREESQDLLMKNMAEGGVVPVGGQLSPSQQQQNRQQTPLALDKNDKALPCPEVWQHISKHPNFDDVDIDDLCSEMRTKAKCSGQGPVIALTEVDRLLDRMTRE